MIKIDKKNLVILVLVIVVFISLLFKSFMYDEEIIIEDNLNEILVINNVETIGDSNINNDNGKEKENIKIHITGEVVNEGIVLLKEGDRIEDAINKAGGTTQNADLSKVNLAYVLEDAQKVYIPSLYEEIEEYVDESAGESVVEKDVGSKGGKINLNKATVEELQTISGVGESTANKIISYRNTNGKFKSIDELKNVSGIGDKKFEDIKEFVTV